MQTNKKSLILKPEKFQNLIREALLNHMVSEHNKRLEGVTKRSKIKKLSLDSPIKSSKMHQFKWDLPQVKTIKRFNSYEFRLTFVNIGHKLERINVAEDDLGSESDAAIKIIANECPNLRFVDITGLELSSKGIQYLSTNCHKIICIRIYAADDLSDDDLINFFNVNRSIEELELSDCPLMTGKCLQYITTDMIEHLSLINCPALESSYLENTLYKFDYLYHLRIAKCPGVTDSVLEVIGKLKTLNVLHIQCCSPGCTPTGMEKINGLPNLKDLKLSCSDAVTDEYLFDISNYCKDLEVLDVSWCNVTMKGLMNVTKLEKLKDLSVSNHDKINNEGLVKLLELMPNLHELEIGGRPASLVVKSAVGLTSLRKNNVSLKIHTHIGELDKVAQTILDNPRKSLTILPLHDRLLKGSWERMNFLRHGDFHS